MEHPHEPALVAIEEFFKRELPELSVFRNPEPEPFPVGGTLRLDRGRTPEHLIKIERWVLEDFSSSEVVEQLRALRLIERLRTTSGEKCWVKVDESSGRIMVSVSDWTDR